MKLPCPVRSRLFPVVLVPSRCVPMVFPSFMPASGSTWPSFVGRLIFKSPLSAPSLQCSLALLRSSLALLLQSSLDPLSSSLDLLSSILARVAPFGADPKSLGRSPRRLLVTPVHVSSPTLRLHLVAVCSHFLCRIPFFLTLLAEYPPTH